MPDQSKREPLVVFAAGSLKAAFRDIAGGFEASQKIPVKLVFGASGLLRRRIERGETAHLYASANLRHPLELAASGAGGPVAAFTRNSLCILAQDHVMIDEAGLLDALLDPAIRLGTSTPVDDPCGDYAWDLFRKADALVPGARARLEAKALQLTGNSQSAKAPSGSNQYAWMMENDRADVFLTYRTNAVLAKRQMPSLRILQIPAALRVYAEYGLIVLGARTAAATALARLIRSARGQGVLAKYGFETNGESASP